MSEILGKKFFARSAFVVAEELLGKRLVRKSGKKTITAKINEVEVYEGFEDKASHARSGKTKRNEPMFGEEGAWYVYLTYGMHWMLNIVTGSKGYPSAVLIRGSDEISGPARLTKFMKIDKEFNGKRASQETGLWIEGGGKSVSKKDIKKLPRVGIDHSGSVWSKKPYRFIIENIDT